jgi:VWFA-related protein
VQTKGSRSRHLALASAFLLASGWLVLQSAPTPAAQNAPAIHVTTHLVQLNVVVHDKQGDPVSGLRKDDFTILDGGKKQQISVFSVTEGNAMQPPLEPLPPDVFSNRVARQGSVPTNVSVILLDGLFTKFEDQAYARWHLIKFLTQLQPQDRVALYTLGDKLSIIQDFTSDPSPLIEAIRQYQGHVPTPPQPGVQNAAALYHFQDLTGAAALAGRQLDGGLYNLAHRSLHGEGWPAKARVLDTLLRAFEDIADRLSGLPGHKSLIWMTGIIPRDFTLLFDEGGRLEMMKTGPLSNQMLRTAEALNRADVAIYPIDARGLFTDPAYSATEQYGKLNPRVDSAGNANAIFHSQLNAMVDETVDFSFVGEKTGGRGFYNTNDLKGSLRKALDDSEVNYTLGYYPDHNQWDGRFRPVKVKVDRKDVEVRYRAGYYADAQPVVTEKNRLTALKEAAESPLEATGVPVTVRIQPYEADNGPHCRVTVHIEVRGLDFWQDKGLRHVSFQTWVGQYSSRGSSVGGILKTVSADLKENEYQKFLSQGGLNLTLDQRVKHDAKELRVVVRDGTSGALGSVRIPLPKSL